MAWYLTDRLGSVRVLTNNSGAVLDEIDYDAYGNILSQTDSSASDRYMWTGQQYDSVTGLQYNRARCYDPTTGRWTTEDPLGFSRGYESLSLCSRSADALRGSHRARSHFGNQTRQGNGGKLWQVRLANHLGSQACTNIKGKRDTDIVGVIIQRIVTMFWAVDANGKYVPLFGNKSGKRGTTLLDYSGLSYLEAWKVQNDGKVVPSSNFLGSTANDWYWFSGTLPKKTCGWIETVGLATYYPGLEPWRLKGQFGFEENWAKGAGILLSYAVPPGLVPQTDLWGQIKYIDKRLTSIEEHVAKSKIQPSETVEHAINVRWDLNKNDGKVVVTSREPM